MGALNLLAKTSASPISVTETVNINNGAQGAASKLYLLLDIDTITGTWDVTVNKRIGAATVKIGEKLTLTSGNLVVIPLEADFDGTDANEPNHAIPIPDQVVFTEQVAGTLDARVFMATSG